MKVRTTVTGVLIAVGVAVGAGATALTHPRPPSDGSDIRASSPVARDPFPAVGALGRIEPQSRVLRLHAPTSMEGARIETLMVAEGQTVERGQIVALLDVFARRESAVKEAEAKVEVARARLGQVRSGTRAGDIAAQDAMVLKAGTGLKNAELELRRAESLVRSAAVSAQEVEERRLRVESEKMVLSQARYVLEALREVRPVDIKYAEAELLSAESSVFKARADLEAARVRALIGGTILKLHARAGERVGDMGVADIGDLTQMYAVAEVYEADIPRIKLAQNVRLKVGSYPDEMSGRVEEISLRVGRKVVLDNDPVADTDARVVEVRIRLSDRDAVKVRGLSNARVQVAIDTETLEPVVGGR